MQISDEVRDAHKSLSDTSLRFLEYCGENPEATKQAAFESLLASQGLKIDFGKLHPWPTFVNRETNREIQRAGTRVFDLIRCIPERLLGNDPKEVARFYNVGAREAEYFLFDTSRHLIESQVGRGDFILGSDGFKCVEYNVGGHIGGWDANALVANYLNIPFMQTFFQRQQVTMNHRDILEDTFQHLLHTHLRKYAGHSGLTNIAIILPGYDESAGPGQFHAALNHMYHQFLQKIYRQCHGYVFFSGFPLLGYDDSLHKYKGNPLHILLQIGLFPIPLEALILSKMGKLTLLNSTISWILCNKLNLAALSKHQESDIFSPEEKETISRYIPWTRQLSDLDTDFRGERIDLKEALLAHPELFTIKPAAELGGTGVVVGKTAPEEEWRSAVETNIGKSDWLAQEYVEALPYLFPLEDGTVVEHASVWGFFVFGSQYVGGFLRIIPKQKNQLVINYHLGAKESIIVEVDE
jgi:hypothetical protein